ncbi:hypothetical protein, partial [Altererythrobacter ishigakiensis]
MRKIAVPFATTLLLSVCIAAPAEANPGGGNHYGWCNGVGNKHHSTGCGGLPTIPPQTVNPVVTVNSVNENRP